MLHFILITVCVLLNAICLWSIHILLKDMDNLTWKYYLKYLSGIPVGAPLSLLLSPITVQNIILLALMGGIVGELLSLLVLTCSKQLQKCFAMAELPSTKMFAPLTNKTNPISNNI